MLVRLAGRALAACALLSFVALGASSCGARTPLPHPGYWEVCVFRERVEAARLVEVAAASSSRRTPSSVGAARGVTADDFFTTTLPPLRFVASALVAQGLIFTSSASSPLANSGPVP